MKTNFSMLFYTKKQKNYKLGPVPIYLRITVDGKRLEITTGRECEPKNWNSKSGRAMGTKEEIKASMLVAHPALKIPILKHVPFVLMNGNGSHLTNSTGQYRWSYTLSIASN